MQSEREAHMLMDAVDAMLPQADADACNGLVVSRQPIARYDAEKVATIAWLEDAGYEQTTRARGYWREAAAPGAERSDSRNC